MLKRMLAVGVVTVALASSWTAARATTNEVYNPVTDLFAHNTIAGLFNQSNVYSLLSGATWNALSLTAVEFAGFTFTASPLPFGSPLYANNTAELAIHRTISGSVDTYSLVGESLTGTNSHGYSVPTGAWVYLHNQPSFSVPGPSAGAGVVGLLGLLGVGRLLRRRGSASLAA